MKNKTLWIVLGSIFVIGFIFISFFVSKYNGFVTSEENVDNKWAQVENQLQRRSDLIGNLVETVKGYAKHEEDIFTTVAEARSKLAGAETPEDAANAEQEVSSALSRLLVVVENYPDLKANQQFTQLMDSLEGTENRIAVARKDYNDVVTTFNKGIKTFPNNVISGIFGFESKKYFEVSEEAKEVPKVDFGTEE